MPKLSACITLAFFCVFTSGCAGGPSQAAPPATSVAATPTNVGEAGNYRLGAGDQVRVIVFNEPALSGQFSVGSQGGVSLPLVGDLQVQGMTLGEFAAAFEAKLKQGYVREPKVSAEIVNYRPFYILGEVTKPGTYPYSAGLTVDSAVATAGGYTYRANKNKIFIKRAGAPTEQSFRNSPGVTVEPGDTLRVPERYF